MNGTTTIKGNNPFRIGSTDFFISPLSADAELHIRSIANGVVDEKKVADIKGGEYTKVTGSVPFTEFCVTTPDTFYIKW